jgi:hypothetical protein
MADPQWQKVYTTTLHNFNIVSSTIVKAQKRTYCTKDIKIAIATFYDCSQTATEKTMTHGLINCMDSKTKYRHLKKMTCEGTYSQSCRYCQSSFVNCCPSNLLSGSTLPPPPCVKAQYLQTMCCWEGVGCVESC